MLAYLDALIAALTARDPEEIARLLAHPLARVLTREARHEATARLRAAAEGTSDGPVMGAPLRLLQLQHQTAQLLDGRTDREDPAEYRRQPPAALRQDRASARAKRRGRQMELPLSA